MLNKKQKNKVIMKGVKSLSTLVPATSHLDLKVKIKFVCAFKNAVDKVDADNEKNYYGLTNVSNGGRA